MIPLHRAILAADDARCRGRARVQFALQPHHRPRAGRPDSCGFGWFGGASAAAPQVAGAAGLIWTANPTWSAKDVVDRILGTARQPNPNNLLGRCATEGVLDIDAALP